MYNINLAVGCEKNNNWNSVHRSIPGISLQDTIGYTVIVPYPPCWLILVESFKDKVEECIQHVYWRHLLWKYLMGYILASAVDESVEAILKLESFYLFMFWVSENNETTESVSLCVIIVPRKIDYYNGIFNKVLNSEFSS